MNTSIYRIYSILLTLVFFFFSCEKKQKRKEQKKELFSPPLTIIASDPIVTLSDTCPKPTTFVIPTKSNTNHALQTKRGTQTIKLTPPITTPLLAGEAGGFTFMQNYNTEQGLPISSVNCGYSDKSGNLWFGTQGGGVSRYDGKAFTNFTTAQGLAGISVLSITEDKTGNLWFCTYGGGVSRYDGKTFTTFTTLQGLASNYVMSSTEDKMGNLWFGTYGGGVSRYTPSPSGRAGEETFTNFTEKEGLSNNTVRAMLEDKNGNLWFGTDGGVTKYDGQQSSNGGVSGTVRKFTHFTEKEGLVNNAIVSMLEDKNGNLWFGTVRGGVSCLSPVLSGGASLFTNFTTDHGLANNNVLSISEDKTGNIWFGTHGGGVSRYTPSPEFIPTKEGGRAGVGFFTNFTTAQGLASNIVSSITRDKTGNLWFGTQEGGLSRYDGKAFTSFTKLHGLGDNRVFCIREDKRGNLWFGTLGGGISRYAAKVQWIFERDSAKASFTNFTTDQGLANNSVLSITEDETGNLWFATQGGGVSRYDGKSFTNFTKIHGLADNNIETILKDKKGNLWFGTYGGGVSRYTGPDKEGNSSFITFTTAQGLANNTVFSIAGDKTGNLWFGTDGGGVSCYDGKSFTNYTTAHGLANNTVLSIIEDKAGNIWLGTSGGGVSKYEPSVALRKGSKFFTNFTTAQGLADDIVYAIVEDTLKNMLWFGTNRGLSGLKLNSLSLEKSEAKFENFNKNTGYPIKDLNTNALFIDSKGIIWAGTGDKLVRFDYKGIRKNPEPPTIFIQSIKINNSTICWHNLTENQENSKIPHDSLSVPPNITEEITTFGRVLTEEQRLIMNEKFSDIKFDGISRFYPLPDNLELPFKHNNVTIDFAAVEPARPYLVRYQYMLEGYDNEWSPLTNKTTATFGNIHEGNYTFRLQALSSDGIWSKPVTYTFKVLPPLYRTWLAYSIYLIAASGFLFSLYRWRTASLRKDKEILEQTVKERTSEVLKQKNIVEEKNKIVEEQKKVVLEKNLKITDSINYAKRIQQAILPSQELIKSFLPDSFIFFRPKDIVSGDFYWFAEKKDTLLIAVADCTGHGVPGAFMSMIGNTLLNEIVNVKNSCEPDQILYQMNEGIVNLLRQSSNESTTQDDGMDISILSINKTNREIAFAGANHFSYLINHNQLETIKGDVFSIGGMFGKADVNFTSKKIKVEKGSTVYLFTDGFADQFGGEKNTKFLSGRFEKLLQSIQQQNMEQQQKQLIAAFDEWIGNRNQTDDVLVVGIRI